MADGLDVSEMMKRAVQANAKFYKGWMDLSLEYIRGISEIIGGPSETGDSMPEMDSGTGALILEGEAGALARGSFLVTNDLEHALSCTFVSSGFRDHANMMARAAPVFDPPTVQLGAGEQRVIQVSIVVSDTLVAGVGYAGEFSIKGMEGFAVPVVLRRQHTPGESSPSDRDPEQKPEGSNRQAPRAAKPVRKRAMKQSSTKTRPKG